MGHELIITPSGHLALVEQASGNDAGAALPKPLVAAFADSGARGLLHLATGSLWVSPAACPQNDTRSMPEVASHSPFLIFRSVRSYRVRFRIRLDRLLLRCSLDLLQDVHHQVFPKTSGIGPSVEKKSE
jgi:hypothetical protein